MSEFRLFCCFAVIGIGLACAIDNHGLAHVRGGEIGILVLGLVIGFAAVALFGRRSA